MTETDLWLKDFFVCDKVVERSIKLRTQDESFTHSVSIIFVEN